MKITFFSDTFFPQVDGVANAVKRLAEMMAERGHDVQVVTVSKGKKESGDKKYPVIRLPSLPALVYPGHRFTMPARQAIRRLKKNPPDIIHTHTQFTVGWEAVQCAKYFCLPLVGTSHTFYDYYLKHVKIDYHWGKKLAWKLTVGYYNRCDLVLSPSRSLAEEMKKNGLQKPVEIAPNPISPIFFHPAPDPGVKKKLKENLGIAGKSFVYMGRVSYEKSIDKIIEAFALVLKTDPSLTLVIVGDGPEKRKLEELARAKKISENVVFTGFLSGKNLVDALVANDIYVTASASENMPLSVLEAMAIGLPIVAVSALGIPEIVRSGQNGLLAESNEPKILAEKMLRLMQNDALRKEFSNASAEFAKQHSYENVARQHEEIYSKLIESRS